MSTSFLSAMNTRANDFIDEENKKLKKEQDTIYHHISDNEEDECCEFCGEYDDCLMMCEGCDKSGCSECVKSYYGEYFGDCKKCCAKAGFPKGNGWEKRKRRNLMRNLLRN